MISDYEDDEHFCIKCHATITGLENYVTHRKSNCPTKSLDGVPKSPLPSQLLVQDEAFDLKADDFFSSLQLQSSTKKQVVQPSTSGKNFSGILTRSKISAVLHGSFLPQSKSGQNAWIGGHQLKELGSGDNQTKLIKAVDNLSRAAYVKTSTTSTEINDYNDHDHSEDNEDSDEYDYEEEEEDEEEIPRNYTGGKWMPEWNYNFPSTSSQPPSSHTGGKWKPLKSHPPQNHTKGKWKPGSPIDSSSFSIPPPTYTKGKWKPVNPESTSPPPNHTKGKWKPSSGNEDEPKEKRRLIEESPPFRKNNGGVQYWCNPCNRLLSSKIVYERHLKSELHYKRTLHDSEFDDFEKRKFSESWSQPNISTSTNSSMEVSEDSRNTKKRKRFRKRIFLKCDVCLARVTSLMMGKHLISHYHCRKGDISLPRAKKMVLENIHVVVLESPYQCGACKFYCNTHEEFLNHWNSPEHTATLELSYGIITCTFCKFSCPNVSNILMYEHLISPEHEEVISVINRSVPIIIKNILPIQCQTCLETFTLNIQLRKHCLATNHPLSNSATDEYQKKEYCGFCEKNFSSVIALQRHLKSHDVKMYFCNKCNVKFDTLDEIIAHRKSQGHKTMNKANLKKCEVCLTSGVTINFDKLEDYHEHMKIKHEGSYDCLNCGDKFGIPQDLTFHVENKVCIPSCSKDKEPPTLQIEDKQYKCDQCMFTCDMLSEFLFHQALHGDYQRVENSKQKHYKCTLCEKIFPKSSLRYHIQNHTNEKSYKCDICDAKFARKNNWLYHLKRHQNKKLKGKRECSKGEEKNFLCAICGSKFANNGTLKKHMLIHNGKQFKCEYPGCIHMARTPADLKAHHRSTHSNEMSFRCDRCDYRGKSKQQLKRHSTIHEYNKRFRCNECSFTCRLAFHLRRHQLIHSGAKPFICPHCEYRCNNLENLRKHVLSTNKHPGKCLYECKFCNDEEPFRTNFAKEFKAHLLADHGDIFGSVTEAASYIAGIYDSVDDATTTAKNKINPTMLDERVIPETTFENKGHQQHHQEELFPMYIIAKDDVVYVDKDSWCMVGNFDVDEESGALVSDADPLFQEHFG